MTEHVATVLVERRSDAADGVVELTLRCLSGHELPPWTPGAHIDLMLPDGSARQYSLCGNPDDRSRYRIAVLLGQPSRGGSRYVHEELHVGAAVAIRGPRNNFELVDAPTYLFIAGGIGITPILPMIATAETRGARWSLLYGGRSRRSMAMANELSQYGERVRFVHQDEHGLLDLDRALSDLPPGTPVYCCGPEPLLDAVENRVRAGLHVERFAPREREGDLDCTAFDVELLRSGLTLTVPPHKSILDVIEAAGVPVLSSCREGTCGSCETQVAAGEPDHRDDLLDDEERKRGDVMMICVSRSRSRRLVLEL